MTDDIGTRFASNVRRLREKRHWSQAEVARRLTELGQHIGGSRVSAIELYGRGVTLDLAEAFANVLDVPLSTLLDLDGATRVIAIRHANDALHHAARAITAAQDMLGPTP